MMGGFTSDHGPRRAHLDYLDHVEAELVALRASPDYPLALAMARAMLKREAQIMGLSYDDDRHEQASLDVALLAAKDAIAIARKARRAKAEGLAA